jgi:hypothetical protein
VPLDDTQRLLGLDKHPSEFIANYVMVASPVIRPDRRVQNTVKSQDDYTVSLQTISKHVLMMNEMADSDPRFSKIYESFIEMLEQY